MALKPLQAGSYPLGQFDALDTDVSSFLGGECVMFATNVTYPGTELAAEDVNDGYTGQSNKRTVVTRVLANAQGATDPKPPIMLADDGTTGYGTLFGTVVGATVGKVVTGGSALGPSTALGSGKVTCWNQSGLYAVSLDAVDSTAFTGLVPGNLNLRTGVPLYASITTGKLTPTSGSNAWSNSVVGRFIEFAASGSLVSTPRNLVAALNSPSGSAAVSAQFVDAVIHFDPQYNAITA